MDRPRRTRLRSRAATLLRGRGQSRLAKPQTLERARQETLWILRRLPSPPPAPRRRSRPIRLIRRSSTAKMLPLALQLVGILRLPFSGKSAQTAERLGVIFLVPPVQL